MFEMTISGDIALGQSTHKWSCGKATLEAFVVNTYTQFIHICRRAKLGEILPRIFFSLVTMQITTQIMPLLK
jgi:hypothetical protein